jgi:hypothetical protein
MFYYRKSFFDPASLRGFTLVPSDEREDWAYDAGPDVDPSQRHFVFAEEAVLALNVSLATRRPLLISGEPRWAAAFGFRAHHSFPGTTYACGGFRKFSTCASPSRRKASKDDSRSDAWVREVIVSR